jgi:hypothetical protein
MANYLSPEEVRDQLERNLGKWMMVHHLVNGQTTGSLLQVGHEVTNVRTGRGTGLWLFGKPDLEYATCLYVDDILGVN